MTEPVKKSFHSVTETLLDQLITDSTLHSLYVDLIPFSQFALQGDWTIVADTVTVKVYGTVENGGIEGREYMDITAKLTNLLGAAAGSYTDDVILVSTYPLQLTSIKITYQRTAGSGNTTRLHLSIKKY